MHKHSAYIVSVAALAIACCQAPQGAGKDELAPLNTKFDRAQTLIYNLNHAPHSAGYHLLTAIRMTKDLDSDISQALFQVNEADKGYAKLRGRADDRNFAEVSLKIEKAQQSRTQLELDLKDAYLQLKDSIEDTLVTDTGKKKKGKK